MSPTGPVSLQVDDCHVAVITINNPPANVLSVSVMDSLSKTVRSINADPGVRAVVIADGSRKFFSAGADIKELAIIDTESKGREFSARGQRVFNEIESAPKVYIAAIEGHCLGGGLELALACHLRVAGSEAAFGFPEINLGLMPGFGGTQRLPRLVGTGRALEWMLTGKIIDAEEAKISGLVNQKVKNGAALETALNLGNQIQAKSSHSAAAILQTTLNLDSVSWQEKLLNESRAFGSLFETQEAQEGIKAFLKKP